MYNVLSENYTSLLNNYTTFLSNYLSFLEEYEAEKGILQNSSSSMKVV